jgi:hypothetical protein
MRFNTLHHIHKLSNCNFQWRIQDFVLGGTKVGEGSAQPW